MMFVKIFLFWLFQQDNFSEQAIHKHSINDVYSTEGSTINMTLRYGLKGTYLEKRHKYSSVLGVHGVKTSKYDIVLRPSILQFQIINVTASDKGFYWFGGQPYLVKKYQFDLTITNISCPFSPNLLCAIEGSSPLNEYVFDFPLYHSTIDVRQYFGNKSRIVSNITIHADIQIHNVSRDDEAWYELQMLFFYETTSLQLANVWFNNQTDLKTIVGQEGKEMEIKCSTNTVQYITGLNIESNRSIIAIGDNQSVSYLFVPDKTDHLTTYTCIDSKHSSIRIKVKLIIRYAPVVKARDTNTTIECDCNGFPAIYSVYRLDQISKDGKLVRSVNLNTESFHYNMEPFPYQQNGRYTCFVSNGIPDINGKVLQTWSIDKKYEGPPVFAPENIHFKPGRVGHQITLSFYIYSYPDIGGITIENIGQKPIKRKQIKHYNIWNSTLLYSQYNKIVGIEGYEILIESRVLTIDDFQLYRITAKNRLGESKYNFAIIDNENLHLNKRNMTYFMILCSILTTVFVVYMITIHVCLCINHIRTRGQRHRDIGENHNYHAYDEIGTISYRNSRPLDTDENEGVNLREQHGVGTSNCANLQSTDDITTELTADNNADVVRKQRQLMYTTSDDTNRSSTDLSQIPSTVIAIMNNITNCNQTLENGNTEASGDKKSQTSYDSDCDALHNVMVDSVDNEYENNYQFQENHMYIEMLGDRHNSMTSTNSSTNQQQRLETGLTKKPVYINLQF